MTLDQADQVIALLTQVHDLLIILDQWMGCIVGVLGAIMFFVAVRSLTGSVR